MATRSTISIRNDDKSVTSVYCHWDGYISHNGDILYKHYNTEENVRKLISFGDLSSLGEVISEEEKTLADENVCVFYARDRDESTATTRAETFSNWKSAIMTLGHDYNYLFVPGDGWFVSFGRNENLKPLSEVFES